MKRFLVLSLFILVIVVVSCKQAKVDKIQNYSKEKKKIDAWIHFHPPLKSPYYFEEAKKFGRWVKDAGYSTIVMLLPRRWFNKTRAKELVKYIKYDLGLQVIPSIKLLGKSQVTFGRKFMKKHPELFVGNIIDPYAIYKNKPAYESLIIPIIDEHIEIFEHPKYFMLGWDEYNTEDLKKIAEKHGKTVGDIWAGTLNRVTEYLSSKGITPIIFGDQLLSRRLTQKDNPIGYPSDKRFKFYSAVHGKMPENSRIDLINYVKDINNRGKIIVADWHYAPEKEYPSIDYFQWLGFKEVIPVTWGLSEENMKYFALYAQKRGIRRFMTSIWHFFTNSEVKYRLLPTIYNNIYYFEDPTRKIPPKPKIIIINKKSKKHVVFASPGDTVILKMEPCGRNLSFTLHPLYDYPKTKYGSNYNIGNVINIKNFRKEQICLRGGKNTLEWKIPKDVRRGLWTIHGYSMRDDRYILYSTVEGGLYIGKTLFTTFDGSIEKKYPDILLFTDFEKSINYGKKNYLVYLYGRTNIHLGIVSGEATVKDGSLICRGGGMFIPRSEYNTSCMKADKTLVIDFSIDRYPLPKEDFSTLFAWGGFNGGFRIIIWKKNKLYAQLFGENWQRVYLKTKESLKIKRKYRLTLYIAKKHAELYLNGRKEDSSTKEINVRVYFLNFPTLGFSYKGTPNRSQKGENRFIKPFYGKIYLFEMWDKLVHISKN